MTKPIYITIKQAAELTGMTANAIRVAGYAGKIDMVRSGSGGYSSDKVYHNEVSVQSLHNYIANRDPRGRKGLRDKRSGGAGK